MVPAQPLEGGIGDTDDILLGRLGIFSQEVIGQEGNVDAPFPFCTPVMWITDQAPFAETRRPGLR